MNACSRPKLELASDHEGKRYLFPGGNATQMFDANRDGFSVAYDGWSATAIALAEQKGWLPRAAERIAMRHPGAPSV